MHIFTHRGGEYGLYWGRGAMQVTCRKGSGPGGSDFCPAYSDLNIYYADYLTSKGWWVIYIYMHMYICIHVCVCLMYA